MGLIHGKHHHWLVASGLKEALFWKSSMHKKARCQLCPRNCLIAPNSFGYCHARFNDDGVLKTAIWGKLLLPSIEPIETEAVYHYWPGASILSLGNLGCNLNCDFCQNWESSNIENLKEEYITYYTPEEIINLAKALGKSVISFTYNDPVIWFEFVYETAKLAQQEGIKTLFKSAAFISSQAAEKLTEVIDIFSISIKSFDPETFSRMSKGSLDPVLDATKIVFRSSRHLEISNLIVTALTDNVEKVRHLARWVRDELSDQVPVHFVRFHPAYKYTHFPRTSINFLEKAKKAAIEEGLQHVYIGNTYRRGHADTYCKNCGALLIERFGLFTRLVEITPESICSRCGRRQKIELQPAHRRSNLEVNSAKLGEMALWEWSNVDARNLHLEIQNNSEQMDLLICEHMNENDKVIDSQILKIPGKIKLRYAVGQTMESEVKVRIKHNGSIVCQVVELLDRAHFPLSDTTI